MRLIRNLQEPLCFGYLTNGNIFDEGSLASDVVPTKCQEQASKK